MSERVHIGRHRALVVVTALAIGAAFGSVVPVPASAAGPTRSGPTIRLSVVPRSTAFAARQSALAALGHAGLGAAPVGPGHPAGSAYQLEVPTSQLAATLSALRSTGTVQSVEPVHAMSLLDVPSDSHYADQAPYLKALDLPRAWDVTHGSAAVRVAVIDSGVTTSHPDLSGKVVARYNAVTGTSSVTDAVGHGTMVASMIAANTDNSAGIAGAGWNTDLLAVKVADSHNTINDADVAEGVDWAVDHGADVINLSLGGAAAGTALKTAIAHAVQSNVVVVAAAGNDGTSAKFYPAALPGVVAVGATSPGGTTRAAFSQHGSWVDVAAPGVGIVGANRSGSGYLSGDGTSFAAPLVSGVAALIRASRPTLSASGVVTSLTATASTRTLGFAHGVVDAYKALGYKLVLPGPTVTSPTPGAHVGGYFDADITVPAGVDADTVRVSLPGRHFTVDVELTGDSVKVPVPGWGSAGSRTLRVVACRQTLCSSTGTDVPVVVEYAAPVLTAPSDGAHETAAWTVNATSDAPAVRFLADGTSLGTDTTTPYSLAVPLAKLTSGSHTISAVSCAPGGGDCDASNASAVATITVAHLAPTITSLTPTVISPNGDGVQEHTSVRFSLDAAAAVTMRVTDSVGSTVRTVSLGKLAAGAHVWNWNGANDSAHVVSGTYVVHLDAVGDAPDSLTGSAARSVRVDVVRPTVTSIATTYGTVFPQSDGYRDKTYLSVRVSEVSTVVYRVTSSSGAVVWTGRVAGQPATRARVTWKGTKTSGAKLPAGRYVVRATVTDPGGNAVRSTGRVITISWRKTVVRTWIKTVTAEGPSGGGYEATTTASYVARDSAFGSGALRFHASSTGAVRTVNELSIPSALVYRTVAVGAYGRGVNGGTGYIALLDDDGNELDGHTQGASTGYHAESEFQALGYVLDGHRARWEFGTSKGNTYEVRSYSVTVNYLAFA